MTVPTQPKQLTHETARSFAGLNIVPAREMVNNGLCLALCGPAGSGKTVTAANIYKSDQAGKVLILDAEAGSSSVADMPVDVATVKRWADLQDVGKEVTRNGTSTYGTIVIDNMTEIQNMRLQEIAGGQQPQIQHFGQCTADLLKLTRYWRDLSRDEGMNVIFCVWEETEQDPQTTRWVKHVFFTPKLALSWPGIVTMIGHIWPVRRKPDIRQLSFTVSPDTDAKFRVSPVEKAAALPTEIFYHRDDPVLADMLNVIRGAKPWPTDRYLTPKQEPAG
jgi:hypothetical protein